MLPIMRPSSRFIRTLPRITNHGHRPSRYYCEFLEPLLNGTALTITVIQGAHRRMVIQFWRNIGDTRPDFPLAICDAATVDRSELIAINVPEYGGQRLDFEALSVRCPQQPELHAWYPFPELALHEVLAFRTFDSRCVAEKRAFWTPHSALFFIWLIGKSAP